MRIKIVKDSSLENAHTSRGLFLMALSDYVKRKWEFLEILNLFVPLYRVVQLLMVIRWLWAQKWLVRNKGISKVQETSKGHDKKATNQNSLFSRSKWRRKHYAGIEINWKHYTIQISHETSKEYENKIILNPIKHLY